MLCSAPGRWPATASTAGLFTRSDPRLERPDMQIKCSSGARSQRDKERVMPHPFPGFTLSPVHLRPDGRGTVRLASSDPLAPPAVLFDYLRTDYDMQAVIFGIRLVPQDRRAAGTAARTSWTKCSLGRRITRRRRPARLHSPERRVQPASHEFLRHGSGARTRSSIRACACTGSTGCAWRTHRSCRSRWVGTPMRRPS